ncbi:MAG TPA: hypothetical protein PJ986_07670 [Gammaproteobacteria bacterium]|nr:hypothetical protein [Gammaproteobacteria bacterium]
MSDSALPALPPAARSALLAGNRRLAVALVRQASDLDQQAASELVALHLAHSPELFAPAARLDRWTLWCSALAGVVACALYLLLQSG